MATKNKEYSTILIVGKGHEQVKSIPIKTIHLERLKHYIFSIVGVFLIMILGLVFLVVNSHHKDQQNQQLNTRLVELKKQLPLATDTNMAKSYIGQIESKLQHITDYLSNRGVRGFKKANSGGNPTDNTGLTAIETYKLYDEYLGRIIGELTYTPLGYPHASGKSSTYGYRKDPFKSGRADFHSGIDIRGNTGDKVKATANGRIFLAGWFQGYGNCVRIRHANGYETLYGHLSKILVANGQLIKAGDVVGLVGSTGHSTGPHLHYEVRMNGRPINPNNFLHLN